MTKTVTETKLQDLKTRRNIIYCTTGIGAIIICTLFFYVRVFGVGYCILFSIIFSMLVLDWLAFRNSFSKDISHEKFILKRNQVHHREVLELGLDSGPVEIVTHMGILSDSQYALIKKYGGRLFAKMYKGYIFVYILETDGSEQYVDSFNNFTYFILNYWLKTDDE